MGTVSDTQQFAIEIAMMCWSLHSMRHFFRLPQPGHKLKQRLGPKAAYDIKQDLPHDKVCGLNRVGNEKEHNRVHDQLLGRIDLMGFFMSVRPRTAFKLPIFKLPLDKILILYFCKIVCYVDQYNSVL